VAVNQWVHPVGAGTEAALGLCPGEPALAVDHERVILPVDVFVGESGQLGHSPAGVEQCLDNEALLVGLTC
jgi:hypothetical protein